MLQNHERYFWVEVALLIWAVVAVTLVVAGVLLLQREFVRKRRHVLNYSSSKTSTGKNMSKSNSDKLVV